MNKGFYTNDPAQTIQPESAVIFSTTVIPDGSGRVGHLQETGTFTLQGGPRRNTCNCCGKNNCRQYPASFSANIAIPEGGTVEAISVALAIDGGVVPASTMIVTPSAVNQYFNISVDMPVPVLCGCCQTFSVINTSSQAILMQNASLQI